jgi:hypothetical protein
MKLPTRISILACIFAGLLAAAIPALAQSVPPDTPMIPAPLEKRLAARASNVDEVTLDKNMLNFGSQFLNSKDKNNHQVQQMIRNLNAIYVRDFKFDQPGAYTEQDVQTIRHQFLGPEWSPMVHERSKNGKSSDVFVKLVDGQIHGMFVLDAEPEQLSLVYISGVINPTDIGQLGGNFGIPSIPATGNAAKSSGSAK